MKMESEYRIRQAYENVRYPIRREGTDATVDGILWAVEKRRARLFCRKARRYEDELICKALNDLRIANERARELEEDLEVERIKRNVLIAEKEKQEVKIQQFRREMAETVREMEKLKRESETKDAVLADMRRDAEVSEEILRKEKAEKEKAIEAAERLKERVKEAEKRADTEGILHPFGLQDDMETGEQKNLEGTVC